MGLLDNAFKKATDVHRTPTALVISEDKSFLNNVRANLGKNGFIPIITNNPTEALVLAEDHELDVMICDYELSQIDGISLFEQIQADIGKARTPPTLIISDTMVQPLQARCVTAGTAGLQAKDEPIETIIERVISLLEDTELRNKLEMSAIKRSGDGSKDLLTRIASRKHFSRRFNAESVASYRDRNAISILMLSIDKFSELEEQHGTQPMESVLANAAKIIEGELRSRDCVGRYAEHTFAVVLPEAPLDAARAVGDRLRRLLSSTEFGSIDDPIQITLSVGVSSRPTGVRATPNDMITQSLRSCTAAKELGGNKVVADKKLSGHPIALVIGDKNELRAGIGAGLKVCNVEVRFASNREEAKTALESLPTKMVVLVHTGNDLSTLDFLNWTRDKYPKAIRIYANPTPSPAQLQVAINKAGIHYYLADTWLQEELSAFIDEVVYS